MIANKPSYEIGASTRLSFTRELITQADNQTEGATSGKVAAVWRLDANQLNEDDLIDPDELLDPSDLIKPDPASLKVINSSHSLD